MPAPIREHQLIARMHQTSAKCIDQVDSSRRQDEHPESHQPLDVDSPDPLRRAPLAGNTTIAHNKRSDGFTTVLVVELCVIDPPGPCLPLSVPF